MPTRTVLPFAPVWIDLGLDLLPFWWFCDPQTMKIRLWNICSSCPSAWNSLSDNYKDRKLCFYSFKKNSSKLFFSLAEQLYKHIIVNCCVRTRYCSINIMLCFKIIYILHLYIHLPCRTFIALLPKDAMFGGYHWTSEYHLNQIK